MFDIGFSELLLIGVVALVVLGPERLPKVARTAGHIIGRLQRYMANVKADMEREGHLRELNEMRSQFESSKREVEQSMQQVQHSVATTVEEEAHSIRAPLEEAKADTAAALPHAAPAAAGTEPSAATAPSSTDKPAG